MHPFEPEMILTKSLPSLVHQTSCLLGDPEYLTFVETKNKTLVGQGLLL